MGMQISFFHHRGFGEIFYIGHNLARINRLGLDKQFMLD